MFEILNLYCVQELSAKEAARILKLPAGTVKAPIHRARAKLARHVQYMIAPRRQRSNIRNQSVVAFVPRNLDPG